ncbi:HAD-IA family hydrolase [Frigidibacter sp. RF13]|uniref:HAD-IA family hydrolase n=1 Tax=Frigidibacter sp. RF13 TaxID=2997340 RepID=UPI0022711509|nr:HAD-IA family hydrolase [Frigidibacter sp. RF13]MCY1127447.1 HAD-IA family hydrolase [Frigidibacter sp. RF13]
MSRARLVIFDVDGTLVDSQDHILAAMAAGFAAVERPMPAREQVLGIVGLSLPEAVAQLVPDCPLAIQHRIVEAYKGSFGQLRERAHSPLFDGAALLLHRLAADPHVRLAVATGKSRRGLRHVLSAHGLDGMFDSVQVADDHPSKPHPSMVLAALAETGVPAADAVMIGDTSFDMEMGRAARVPTIGVTWGYHPVTALRAAGRLVGTFGALAAALEETWERA